MELSRRICANDGVHVYNEQAVVHEELLSLVRHGEIRRAMAAEAIARAKVDVAVRGLNATVIQDYYSIVLAQRKFANSQISLKEAERFFDVTQKQERAGSRARGCDQGADRPATAPERSQRDGARD